MDGLSLDGLPNRALNALETGKLDGAREALKDDRGVEAADAFEKLLATMLVKEMRRALPNGFFGDGPGAEVFEGWFDEHVGGALAERDALGFAGMVKEDLVRKEAARETELQ